MEGENFALFPMSGRTRKCLWIWSATGAVGLALLTAWLVARRGAIPVAQANHYGTPQPFAPPAFEVSRTVASDPSRGAHMPEVPRAQPEDATRDWLIQAGQVLDSVEGDDALTRWLVEFSVSLASTPHAMEEAIALLKSGQGTSKLRAVLALLVGVLSPDKGQQGLVQVARTADDLAASAAVRALLLRSDHTHAIPPLAPWFKALWLYVFLDDDLGSLLNPGFVSRLPIPQVPITHGDYRRPDDPCWTFPADAAMVPIWRCQGNWIEKGDTATWALLESIATGGGSGLARKIALEEFPKSPGTDQVIATILRDGNQCGPLREKAYDLLTSDARNWPLVAEGLKSETDPRATNAAVCANCLTVDRLGEYASLLEGVLTRPDVQLKGYLVGNVLVTLNALDRQEGLDALARLARLGRGDAIRIAAAGALGEPPPTEAPAFMQQRLPMMMGLLRDPDPVVAGSGAIALLSAARTGPLMNEARQAIDSTTLSRMQGLRDDPHVPQAIRRTLQNSLDPANPSAFHPK